MVAIPIRSQRYEQAPVPPIPPQGQVPANYAQPQSPLGNVAGALRDPRLAAALMQFGLNTMAGQPLAQAIGGAGAAIGRVQGMADKTKQWDLRNQMQMDEQGYKQRADQRGERSLQLQESNQKTDNKREDDLFEFRRQRAAKQDEAAKKKAETSGGVSANTLFGAKRKDTQAVEKEFQERALFDANYNQDKANELMQKPEYRQKFVESKKAAAGIGEEVLGTPSEAGAPSPSASVTGKADKGGSAVTSGSTTPGPSSLTPDQQALLAQAKQAIAKGKSKAAVMQVLKQRGIDPGLL